MGISSSRHSYNADLYYKLPRRIEARIDTDIPIFVSIISLLSCIKIMFLFCIEEYNSRLEKIYVYLILLH